MIVIERDPGTGAAVVRGGGDAEPLRAAFERDHCVILPGLFGPRLLAWVQEELDRAPFRELAGGHFGELTLTADTSLVARLLFLVNDPAMYRFVAAVAGVKALARFHGRVYRRDARPEHHDGWHDDLAGDVRLVAMSVNLGVDPYEGGLLKMRRRSGHAPVSEVHNAGPGDALLFRVRDDLQHRVTAVTAGEKTALAGWYGAAPPWPLPLPVASAP
jgi:2OG-Fe(II) oxygenase superfamily